MPRILYLQRNHPPRRTFGEFWFDYMVAYRTLSILTSLSLRSYEGLKRSAVQSRAFGRLDCLFQHPTRVILESALFRR